MEEPGWAEAIADAWQTCCWRFYLIKTTQMGSRGSFLNSAHSDSYEETFYMAYFKKCKRETRKSGSISSSALI